MGTKLECKVDVEGTVVDVEGIVDMSMEKGGIVGEGMIRSAGGKGH
jgi:hypothetical protein